MANQSDFSTLVLKKTRLEFVEPFVWDVLEDMKEW